MSCGQRDGGWCGWGRAGRRGGSGAGQAGEDGLHGEGVLDAGDEAQSAATPGTGKDIEIEHAAHQRGDEPWQAATVALV